MGLKTVKDSSKVRSLIIDAYHTYMQPATSNKVFPEHGRFNFQQAFGLDIFFIFKKLQQTIHMKSLCYLYHFILQVSSVVKYVF